MIYRGVRFFFAAVVGVLVPLNLPADPLLSVQFTAGAPGTTAWVAVNYTTDTNAPSLQFDLLYNTNNLTSGDPVGGNALSDHQVATAEVTPGLRRVLIFSFSNSPITNGVLAYVPFSIATNAADHNEFLTLSNVLVVNAAAEVVPSVASNGVLAIAVPPHFSAVFPTNAGAIHLELSGATSRNYVIQSATNLAQPIWSTLYTNTANGGLLKFDDVAAPAFPARFYRAVVAP